MSSDRPVPRRYGRSPFRVVLVHGGPGAVGSLAPVGRALAPSRGVLEPWQSARTVAGEVEELRAQIDRYADPPVVLVGHSWGAWLSLLFAAEHPDRVSRVVLIGSGPLRARDARDIPRRREERLSPAEREEFEGIDRKLSRGSPRGAGAALRRLSELTEVSDSYCLVAHPKGRVRVDPRVYREVWAEAAEMRRSGALLRAARCVRAPITVLHGKDDPHPFDGVVQPLRSARLKVDAVLFERCGHAPWWERYARTAFFRALRAATRDAGGRASITLPRGGPVRNPPYTYRLSV